MSIETSGERQCHNTPRAFGLEYSDLRLQKAVSAECAMCLAEAVQGTLEEKEAIIKYMKYIKIYKKYKTRCPVWSAIDGCIPASLYISWTFVCGAVESMAPLYYPAMPQPPRYKIFLTFRSLGVSVSLSSKKSQVWWRSGCL